MLRCFVEGLVNVQDGETFTGFAGRAGVILDARPACVIYSACVTGMEMVRFYEMVFLLPGRLNSSIESCLNMFLVKVVIGFNRRSTGARAGNLP
jgi:hypothetical protein